MRSSIDVKDETEIPARPSKFIVAAAAILLAGAVGVGALAFRAIPQEVPDLRAPTAALAAARASAAAQAISQKVASVRLMLEALAEKGGARPGRRNATRFAIRAFKKIDGLEQLAAYSLNGKTRWAMRPASSGSMMFPNSKSFLVAHLDAPEIDARVGAPFQPRGSKVWWTPITHLIPNRKGEPYAILTAFMNQKTFAPLMHDAGESAALLTGIGKLITGAPIEAAPLGASFAEAPGFAVVRGQTEANGAYEGGGLKNAGARGQMIGYAKLACCDAIVTSAVKIPASPPPKGEPAVQWLTLSAAGLMILLALGLISRRMLSRPKDPWLDFGAETQSVS